MYPFLAVLGDRKPLPSRRPNSGGRWVRISWRSSDGLRDTCKVQAESSWCIPTVGSGRRACRWLPCSTRSRLVWDLASGEMGCGDMTGMLWCPQ